MIDEERQKAYRREHMRDHACHVWLNQWVHEHPVNPGGPLPCEKPPMTDTLYAWKDLLHFLRNGRYRLQQAFEDALPQWHQQCSVSPVEPVPAHNRLRCILGQEVTTCPILTYFTAHWQAYTQQRIRSGPHEGELIHGDLQPGDLYQTMTEICAWHMFTAVYEAKKTGRFLDYTEGWMLDMTDRMFWERICDSLMGNSAEEEEE
jgi:hypothetical protein